MKVKFNEYGGALIYVLLIVFVFAVIGLGLLTMNLSAAKQFTKKEQQIQARHLAEMGVQHYKAELQNLVKTYNSEPSNYMAYKTTGEVDYGKSIQNYKNGLCSITPTVKVNKKEISVQTGVYQVSAQSPLCSQDKIEISITSTGNSTQTKKIVAANLTIASNTNETEPSIPSGSESDSKPPKKPSFQDSVNTVSTLDDVGKNPSYKVIFGLTNKNPFSTQAAIELLGAVDMNKKSTWTFYNQLLINGSFTMKTAGINLSSLTVQKDFYIGGAFHTENHNELKVSGNLLVMGQSNFGTDSSVIVDGDALFDELIEGVQPHANILIGRNAYFKKPLENVNQNANVCVKGGIYLWKNNNWATYLPSDRGYSSFNKSCLGTSTENNGGSLIAWDVLQDIKAEYRP